MFDLIPSFIIITNIQFTFYITHNDYSNLVSMSSTKPSTLYRLVGSYNRKLFVDILVSRMVEDFVYRTCEKFRVGKIGEFGELWALCQYFTHQLFLFSYEALTF